MPNISVQLRRGTDTEHSSFTGAEGEVTVDTDLDTLRVHDGSTAGGVRLAKHSEIPTGGGGTVTQVDTGTGLTGGPITSTGTISIDAGGVGTTELADDAVTFTKMQNINTATVIGRTSASTGNPEEVSILDEDTMSSDSATALATQQSIKAYVDAQVSTGIATKWDSGWFAPSGTSLSNGSTHTFTHTLGSVIPNLQLWMAKSSTGTDLKAIDHAMLLDVTGGNVTILEFNAQVTNLTSTGLTVQLGANGWSHLDSSGQSVTGNWGTTYTHIRVIAIG